MANHSDFKTARDVNKWIDKAWAREDSPDLEVVYYKETEDGEVWGMSVVDRTENIGYAWDFNEGVYGLDAFSNDARETMDYFRDRHSSIAYYYADGRFVASTSPLALEDWSIVEPS